MHPLIWHCDLCFQVLHSDKRKSCYLVAVSSLKEGLHSLYGAHQGLSGIVWPDWHCCSRSLSKRRKENPSTTHPFIYQPPTHLSSIHQLTNHQHLEYKLVYHFLLPLPNLGDCNGEENPPKELPDLMLRLPESDL